jgi:hypothetical protein
MHPANPSVRNHVSARIAHDLSQLARPTRPGPLASLRGSDTRSVGPQGACFVTASAPGTVGATNATYWITQLSTAQAKTHAPQRQQVMAQRTVIRGHHARARQPPPATSRTFRGLSAAIAGPPRCCVSAVAALRTPRRNRPRYGSRPGRRRMRHNNLVRRHRARPACRCHARRP